MSIKNVLPLRSAASFVAVTDGTGCRCFGQDQHINIMEATMARVLDEILLFSCMAAFVTGIVIAAASLLS
jgi:hypothetical protein